MLEYYKASVLNAYDNRRLLLNSIRLILPNKPNVALIHSDISKFRVKNNEFIWEILFVISTLVEEGWTLIFPSFTFSFCTGKPYISKKSLSETGVLADKVLENLPSAKRTADPIYSFVTIGKKSKLITKLSPKTNFGCGSVFEWLEKQNSNIVMLGCDWEYCTQFHRYEELHKVEYREFKTFKGIADFGEGPNNVKSTMFVRSLDLDPINDFTPVVDKLVANNLINKLNIYNTSIQCANVREIKKICLKQLQIDTCCYLSNKTEVLKKIRDKAERKNNQTLLISVFCNKNSELLEQHLLNSLEYFLPERDFIINKVPFGQMYKILYDKKNNFYFSPPFIKIFIDRLSDLPGVDLFEEKSTVKAVLEYAELIKGFHEASGGWSIVNLFTMDTSPIVASDVSRQNELISKSNQILIDQFKNIDQITFVDLGTELASYSAPCFDPRLEFIAKFPFSDGFSSYLAQSWASLIIAMMGKDIRLIVIDLDNTLWGGVVGEDGIEGLKIGGDYPGNAYKAFQKELLAHQKRGVALAIASKNDEDIALNAISTLPDMLIKESHIQAHSINWEPKWKNIIKICLELNLGLGSVMFIDDNPVEREMVRRNLPEVKVLPLTNDPAENVKILRSSPYLKPVIVTKEDLGRLKDFSVQKERKLMKSTATNLNDYYASLEISLNLDEINIGNASRAAQLCQKTNQFNTTTRRYDQKKLYELKQNGYDILVINYEDKFSSPENIGIIIIEYINSSSAKIDLFLLSCRVLGRGIETAIPNIAMEIVASKGYDNLKAEIIETERNTPVRNVFKDSGFEETKLNSWHLENGKQNVSHWIKYKINMDSTL